MARAGMYMTTMALAAAGVAAQVGTPGVVHEPASQVAFPVLLTPPGSTQAQMLAGTAIRTRTIFGIKVYAFGLYVDAKAARTVFEAYRGVPAARLASDSAFYRRLLDLDVAMTLRLVMTRDVAGPDVASSFDDALKPRVKRAAGQRGLAGGDVALAEFRGFFNLDEIASGTEIVFSCDLDGRLVTRVAGMNRPEIRSPALCWALFDVYLGEKPVSKDARTSVIARFADILTARERDARPAGATHGR